MVIARGPAASSIRPCGGERGGHLEVEPALEQGEERRRRPRQGQQGEGRGAQAYGRRQEKTPAALLRPDRDACKSQRSTPRISADGKEPPSAAAGAQALNARGEVAASASTAHARAAKAPPTSADLIVPATDHTAATAGRDTGVPATYAMSAEKNFTGLERSVPIANATSARIGNRVRDVRSLSRAGGVRLSPNAKAASKAAPT